ncbi:MAG: 16S rRNA processing protein RimM [Desulfovibrionaceae bacterium]|nr:16S rRNA processing protein RimM [Desulfovibrionaceae bacterium]
MENKYIHMGQLVRPHGILGEIVLDWYAISPFSSKLPFFIQERHKSTVSAVDIVGARLHQGRYLLRLAEICDRTAAETLRGAKLLTLRTALPPLDSDEAYICDLLGSEVKLTTGQVIGHFSHVVHGTGNPTWAIHTTTGCEILFPAMPQFLVDLNVEDHTITIAPPDGLLELYLQP